MVTTFLYWNGRVEGCVAPADRNIFPPAVPIATQLPHAAGAAWAEREEEPKMQQLPISGTVLLPKAIFMKD